MYKKAGIVVGITIWVVALLIYFGYNFVGSDKDNNKGKESTSQVVNESKQPSKVKQREVVNPTIKGTLISLDDDVSNSGYIEEGVFVITDKGYVLNKGNKMNMVLPSVTLSSEDGNLVIENYFTESVYKTLSVGDKLQVRYKVISNKKGVKFYLILSIEKLV